MKRLRSLYSSLKLWWKLCPLRYRRQQVALLMHFDDIDLKLTTKAPPDMFDHPVRLIWPERTFSINGRATYTDDSIGFIYLVLPTEKV